MEEVEFYLEQWERLYENNSKRDRLVLALQQQNQQGMVPGHNEAIVLLFLLGIILIL